MKKEEFDGIDMSSLEDTPEDTLGLDVYLKSADELLDEDFYGSLEIWDEGVDSKRNVVCDSLSSHIEQIMRASRFYMVRHYELELKLKLRNDKDGGITKQSRRMAQISKILMSVAWLEINEKYDCWETDTTAIRLRDGKVVVISYEDNDMEDLLEKFKKSMPGGMGGFMGNLQDFKRFIDEMKDSD